MSRVNGAVAPLARETVQISAVALTDLESVDVLVLEMRWFVAPVRASGVGVRN